MARGLIAVNSITRTGIAVPSETTGDASNFHYVPNDGATFLLVRNSNGASTARVLTVLINSTVDGQAVTSRTYSIAAAASKYIGPFPTSIYGTQLNLNPDNAELRITAFNVGA